MDFVQWGIIGCGNVTEVKSGPGFQKAEGSRAGCGHAPRPRRRPRTTRGGTACRAYHDTAEDLIADPEVDAVYIATPPSTHCPNSRCRWPPPAKPCLVEKPMAMTHAECVRMNEAFRAAGVPLFVAYYRRALPRFLEVRRAAGRRRHRPGHGRARRAVRAARRRRAGGRLAVRPGGGGRRALLRPRLALPRPARLPARADRRSVRLSPSIPAAAYAGRGRDGRRLPLRARHGRHGRVELQRRSVRGLDGVDRPAGQLHTPVFTDGDVVVTRGGQDEIVPVPQPAARAPAAHPDDRR